MTKTIKINLSRIRTIRYLYNSEHLNNIQRLKINKVIGFLMLVRITKIKL